jgi:hypothetical protein
MGSQVFWIYWWGHDGVGKLPNVIFYQHQHNPLLPRTVVRHPVLSSNRNPDATISRPCVKIKNFDLLDLLLTAWICYLLPKSLPEASHNLLLLPKYFSMLPGAFLGTTRLFHPATQAAFPLPGQLSGYPTTTRKFLGTLSATRRCPKFFLVFLVAARSMLDQPVATWPLCVVERLLQSLLALRPPSHRPLRPSLHPQPVFSVAFHVVVLTPNSPMLFFLQA